MSLSDELGWFVLGCIIGFFLGYLNKSLQVLNERTLMIKEELDEVDAIVKNETPDGPGDVRPVETKKGRRSIKDFNFRNLALLLVVLLCAYASVVSQISSNGVKTEAKKTAGAQVQLQQTQHQLAKAQTQIKQIAVCAETVLNKTISALNQRTTYTGAQADANVSLQGDQLVFLEVLLGPPPPDAGTATKAFSQYIKSLEKYQGIARKAAAKVKNNPYPATHALDKCIAGVKKENK